MHAEWPEHTYYRDECVVFRKTREAFGGLSNMADGYPLQVLNRTIRYAEALYQACRFPHRPDIQDAIVSQASPMAAKLLAKKYRHDTRGDWLHVRVAIMQWVLQLKAMQHCDRLHLLWTEIAGRPIVEESRHDRFWGAVASAEHHRLSGCNVLGLLWMDIARAACHSGDTSLTLSPPVVNLSLFGMNLSTATLPSQPVATRAGQQLSLRL